MDKVGNSHVLAARFRRFADRECAGVSPLYAALAEAVAEDDALLRLAATARAGQPVPNMLFAAVQALLRRHREHPLAAFYASLTAEPAGPEGAFPSFRAFCLEHREAITEILRQRVVSTNEVQRAACLMPAFARIARQQGEPLQIIEVGASAGLLLLWDRFGYDYRAAGQLDADSAPLTLTCEARGAAPLPLPQRLPRVAGRIGVDPQPLDPADAADADWLRALIWPEQRGRLERLDAALAIAAAARPTILTGYAQDCLPQAAAALPRDGALVVYHAFTLNQFTAEQRRALLAHLDRLGRKRTLFRVGLEWEEAAAPLLTLTDHSRSGANPETLARCDAHGGWIEWVSAQRSKEGRCSVQSIL